ASKESARKTAVNFFIVCFIKIPLSDFLQYIIVQLYITLIIQEGQAFSVDFASVIFLRSLYKTDK
ncbi:MAG: hypothetical protein II614_01605, partial [Ruminococcus sp.]|nr:hypothetical protein [Ruminococcus sp.]